MTVTTRRATETGGRAAPTRHITPKLALAVGMPSAKAPEGWRWAALTELARLESGHTPSRRHPEYWGGDIPWISLADAKRHHGARIEQTIETTNALGIENSSARILPQNTVCLSRTASVGYVLIMGRPMATSQDFVNWICSKNLDPCFLQYLFIAEGEHLLRFASGAVHSTIYFPEVKAFHICHPPLTEQQRIVGVLDKAFEGIAMAKANAEKNLANAREVFESESDAVFTRRGEGWVEKRLGEVVDEGCTLSYCIVQPGDDCPNGLPVVRPTDLINKLVTLNGLKRIDPKLAESYRRTTLRGRELLLCVRGSTGIVSMSAPELFGANVTRGIVPIIFDSSLVSHDFSYFLMTSQQVQRQIQAKTYGAALRQINIGDLRKITIAFPSLNEQKQITDRLNKLSEETRRLQSIYQRKFEALDAIKKSLLHEAFSGNL